MMHRTPTLAFLLGFGMTTSQSNFAFADEAKPAVQQTAEQPTIQVAILLDTSGSMSGLIHQTRTELWSVVNALTDAKKGGVSPLFEVALYEYGQSPIPVTEHHLRMISHLTGDLDVISEQLFKLSTNGGDEYSGAVIQSAVSGLRWSNSNDSLKIIFIAGNEPFTQGPVKYTDAIGKATENDIIINTIHCGDHQVGINESWAHGAVTGNGNYFSIDHNDEIQHIDTPYDTRIYQLNAELNKTYIPYGKAGESGMNRQTSEDLNASSHRKSSINRSLAKSSQYYLNSSWDLVDAVLHDGKSLRDIPVSALSLTMQKMTPKERQKHLEEKIAERSKIQQEMQSLKKKRTAFISKQSQQQVGGKVTLEQALLKALREQAQRKGYTL